MRAWVIAGILLFAGTAVAEDAGDTEVPPLAHGESAPEEAPNYFDAHELGAATLATFAVCQDTIARAYPDAIQATQAAYCSCFADAARWNVRNGRAAGPTEVQVGTCIDITRAQAASPFARQLAVPTAAIADTFDACMAAEATRSTGDRDFVCSCATDAWLAARSKPAKLDDDLARCGAAGRYREAVGQNPTVRQFAATRPAPSGRPIRLDRATPGSFIPYQGNGGGPTRCSDGTYSHSSGRGTCAYHGGISGGHHRRR
jgi:hypothetical protein